jgi:hypothetical protein
MSVIYEGQDWNPCLRWVHLAGLPAVICPSPAGSRLAGGAERSTTRTSLLFTIRQTQDQVGFLLELQKAAGSFDNTVLVAGWVWSRLQNS